MFIDDIISTLKGISDHLADILDGNENFDYNDIADEIEQLEMVSSM